MPKKFKRKDPFDDLDEAFKSEISSMKPLEINTRIAEWAKLAEAQTVAMRADEDLAQKRETVKLAAEPYRCSIKAARLQIAFAMRVLNDRDEA
jgi:hypothetical protein